LLLRSRTESWARDLVARVRDGRLDAPPDSVLQAVASYRDVDGQPLDVRTAAVELTNVLRPTVAIGRFIAFAALALHRYPACRTTIQSGDPGYLEMFVQEVRRFYPFFPSVGGRVRQAFEWEGHHFAEGTWVLLDLYGTNHDPRIWSDPESFDPERFRRWNGSAFNFIPQGGGDLRSGHRCPGERITIELMKEAVRFLCLEVEYDVPPQDLNIELSRMPAQPASRFLLRYRGKTDRFGID
jgi:fatty-acid peroxygenase